MDHAKVLGFRVPEYLVTNSADKACAFVKGAEQPTIVKTLEDPTLLYEDIGQAVMIYTHIVGPNDLTRIEDVRYGPTFFQRFVEKTCDVRVTVIGNAVFAVAIDSGGVSGADVDFRRVRSLDLPHRLISLPRSLESMCLALVRDLDLNFGAIDLVQDSDGEFWFLEINPNGQWAWLEIATGVPLSRRLCDFLQQPRMHALN